MILLSPQVEELAEYCLQRRTTAVLAPSSPINRTEEEKQSAFARSAINAWLEAHSGSIEPSPKREDELDELDDESSPNQGSTIASTSGSTHVYPHPPQVDQSSLCIGISAANIPAQLQQPSPSTGPAPIPIPIPHPLQPPLVSTSLHRGPSSSIAYFAESSNPGEPTGTPLPSLPLPPSHNELPPINLLSTFIADYFSGIAHSSLPIVERQVLRDWIEEREKKPTLSTPNSTDSGPSTSVGHELVFAVLAIAARYTTVVVGAERGSSALVDLYKVQAGQALAAATRAPTLYTVQAALLLAQVDLGRDDLTSASAHFGIALTLAYALGLHQSSSSFYHQDQAGRAEYGVRSFGAIIVLDTLLALRLGRPPLLSSGTFDLPLPSALGPEEPNQPTPPVPLAFRDVQTSSSHVASNLQDSPSDSAGAHPLSTFRELIRLSLAAMPLLYALNYPTDGAPRPIEHLFASFVSWEDRLPLHLRLAMDPQPPTHKFELSLLCGALRVLSTRPRSPKQPISPLCITQTLRTLSLLELHHHNNPSHLSTPIMAPVLATLASVLLSPTAEVGTPSHWQTLVKAAENYSHIFPSANSFLLTLVSLPQTATMSSFVRLREDLARAEQAAKEEANGVAPPGMETLPLPAAIEVSSSAELSSTFGGLEAPPPNSATPSSGRADLDLLAYLGAGDTNASSFGCLNPEPSDSIPVLGLDTNDFVADFAEWSSGIPQDNDQLLRALGVRGPTRPPSPSRPFSTFNAGFDSDLVGRWQGVLEDQWAWPEALNSP